MKQLKEFNGKFLINSRVKVSTFDVYENQIQFRTVEGIVTEFFPNINCYNVLLDEPMMFYGHIPSLNFDPKINNIGMIVNPDKSVTLKVICCKQNNLSYPEQKLRNRLRELGANLVFGKINTIITKPPNSIDYINYYNEDGKIITYCSKDELEKTIQKTTSNEKQVDRIAYKVPHFFGFTKKNFNNQDSREIHFSANRYYNIDFWEGFTWEVKEKDVKPYLSQANDQICGVINQSKETKSDKASSFEKWFICSQQFKTLWMLLKFENWPEKFNNYSDEQIIKLLILPENTENVFIRHEVPFSRYLYAAIFLLAVRNVEVLPSEWNLPKRKLLDTNGVFGNEMIPFEKWWPYKVMY